MQPKNYGWYEMLLVYDKLLFLTTLCLPCLGMSYTMCLLPKNTCSPDLVMKRNSHRYFLVEPQQRYSLLS